MKPTAGRGSRQIVAELELLLTQPGEPAREEVEAAHTRAYEAIQRVNQRLAQAVHLVQSGRRDEAIELAEGPPHVLDEIAVFDSPVIRDWEYWASQFGMPKFAPLHTQQVEQLTAAYSNENQMGHRLRRHRLLALGRGNLRQRIAVLSQLASTDPSNRHWNKSLIEYQRQRLDQLAERANEAHKCDDLRCLTEIIQELKQTRWLTPISKAQVESVQKRINQLRRREATNEAIALAEHIQDAHESGDKKRLAPLITCWRSIEPLADADEIKHLVPEVAMVLESQQQDAQQQQDAVAQDRALQRAKSIRDGATSNEILTVIQRIESTGAEMPNGLRATYRERLEQEQAAQRLKTRLIIGGVGGGIILAGLLAAMVYFQSRRTAALNDLHASVEQDLGAGQLAAAREQLESAPSDDPRFVALRSQLDDQQRDEDLRAAEFDEDATALKLSLDGGQTPADFDKLKKRAAEIAERANNKGERAMAKSLLQQVDLRRESRRDQVMQRARQQSDQILADLQTLTPDRQARSKLAEWNQQLYRLRTDDWLRRERELITELEATSDAVADFRDKLTSGE